MRYRSDESTTQPDGAKVWCANWLGGPTISKIENCRLANLAGDMRRTVTITGAADTYFSIPAECSVAGCRVRGYVTGDDENNLVFRHTYY
jgi:hypothetical protein